ncbi:MAG: hypothetical protein HPM95_10795 [Alphaproteobacteria bacterium]|nr:hypothetical protein [Alphaproteobacteria bacterium]
MKPLTLMMPVLLENDRASPETLLTLMFESVVVPVLFAIDRPLVPLLIVMILLIVADWLFKTATCR